MTVPGFDAGDTADVSFNLEKRGFAYGAKREDALERNQGTRGALIPRICNRVLFKYK